MIIGLVLAGLLMDGCGLSDVPAALALLISLWLQCVHEERRKYWVELVVVVQAHGVAAGDYDALTNRRTSLKLAGGSQEACLPRKSFEHQKHAEFGWLF